MNKNIFIYLFFLLFLNACNDASSKLQTGIWRATLTTESGVEIPFNFEVKGAQSTPWIEIITGEHRYKVEDVRITGDSVFFVMPLFDSQFKLAFSDNLLRGNFVRSSYSMPCVATPNTDYRFPKGNIKPAFNPAGRWSVQIGRDTVIGEFAEKNNVITGSFITPTGDYRFFEGLVADSVLMLSCFDGGFVRLFVGKMINDNTISEITMYSGNSSVQFGSAVRNAEIQLPDAYSVTTMAKGYTTLDFSFRNTDGQTVSLKDDKYKDKVVVVQFSGSWCPNCLDETQFLSKFYNEHKDKMEVVCLAFERSADYETAKSSALRLAKLCDVQYEVLVTCIQPIPQKIMETMPALENFKAFPTTVFIDKKGDVRKIHSGFSGPGTGVHFEKFVAEFTSLINELAAE